MENVIVIVVVAAIVAGVIFYLRRAKKRGVTCVGCPYAKSCGGNCHQPPQESSDSSTT